MLTPASSFAPRRFRRFRDPEGTFVNVRKDQIRAQVVSGELDLEDELLDDATGTWNPLWRVLLRAEARGKAVSHTIPVGWSLLVSQHQSELHELKLQVRRGVMEYPAYVQRREQLRHQVIRGAAPTVIRPTQEDSRSRTEQGLLNSKIGGDYIYVRDLGEGGGGSVSLWTNRHTDERVAIKITKPHFKDHIRNELSQLCAVRSSRIVNVRHYGPIDAAGDQWYIVFDYVPGETLLEYIRRKHGDGQPNAEEIMDVLQGLAEGLADLHRAGIVHRDLKPANIILKPRSENEPRASSNFTPILIDLGLARSGAPSGHSSLGGTIGYQSPEQQRGQSCTAASDVFNFGLIAYELVTGKQLSGANLKVLHDTCPGLPIGLDNLIKTRCASDDLHHRIQDGSALDEALRALRRGEATGNQARSSTYRDPHPTLATDSVVSQHQETFEQARRLWDQAVSTGVPDHARQGFAAEALALLSQSAEAGHTEAARTLGCIYLDGNDAASVDMDHALAAQWLSQAVEDGDPQAMVRLGELYHEGRPSKLARPPLLRSPERAAALFRRAADAGNADGMRWLGYCLCRGEGVEHDDRQAAEWLRRSAEAGSAQGMYWLGRCFFDGRGVAQDQIQAFAWFKKSADAGDADGMHWIGRCFLSGAGVTQSQSQAVMWFRRSAGKGDSQSMHWLGRCFRDGVGVAPDQTQAVEWFRRAAELGNSDSMHSLGRCLHSGHGVQADRRQAFSWFKKSAEAGNTEGMDALGRCLQCGDGAALDKPQAVHWFRKSAEAGNTEGMNSLGRCLQSGDGVALDRSQAVHWFRKSAEAGNSNGMHCLGCSFDNGSGVTQDSFQAAAWFRKSADAGNPRGMHWLGICLAYGRGIPQDQTEAVKFFRMAADAGDSNAMVWLGSSYLHGTGVAKNPAEAVAWFSRSAEDNNAEGMNRLGLCLRDGHGVARNTLKAAACFRRSAETGNTQGMAWFGQCLYLGTGTVQDKAEAVRWFRKSAAGRDTEGMYWLARCLLTGQGVTQNQTEAVTWFRWSAEQGHPASEHYLGECLLNGSGVPQDQRQAVKWLEKSSEHGSGDGMYLLGCCYFSGNGVAEDKAQAVVWFKKAAETGNSEAMLRLGVCHRDGLGTPRKDLSRAIQYFQQAARHGHSAANEHLLALQGASAPQNGAARGAGQPVRASLSAERISAILGEYSDQHLVKGGSDDPRIRTAIDCFAPGIQPWDVLLLYDNAIIESGRAGLILTSQAVHWNDDQLGPMSRAFSEISSVSSSPVLLGVHWFGTTLTIDDCAMHCSCGDTQKIAAHLVRIIQAAIRECS